MHIDYLIAAGFGCIFGLSEIVLRYRDEPFAAVFSFPALLYIAINAGVSALALLVARIFELKFGITGDDGSMKVRVVQVLATGFSAMGLLRSSFLNIRSGNQDVGVGGSVIVQSFLRAADDAIDRKRATSRDEEVKIMETVSFEKAVAVLPAYCLELMQNLTPADQAGFADRVARISKIKADNPAKSRLLGLAIMNVMGPDVLKAAMKSLGKDIQA